MIYIQTDGHCLLVNHFSRVWGIVYFYSSWYGTNLIFFNRCEAWSITHIIHAPRCPWYIWSLCLAVVSDRRLQSFRISWLHCFSSWVDIQLATWWLVNYRKPPVALTLVRWDWHLAHAPYVLAEKILLTHSIILFVVSSYALSILTSLRNTCAASSPASHGVFVIFKSLCRHSLCLFHQLL